MPLSLKQFVKQLSASGVMSNQEITAAQQSMSPPPSDGEQFARALVKGGQLTKFQAQRIYQGKHTGLLLGDYVVLDTVGSGGMGEVYLAEHRRMGRKVALKTLPPALANDEPAVRRFHREVRAAAKLSHPNIVTAYDAGEAKGVHYFVMELVEGRDLSDLVAADGKLTLEKAIDYTLQAARGLQFAHQQGIVHRDIKPSNLLLDADGTVKILDMGLARMEADPMDANQSELTQTGTVMGTVDYMAPEQAMDTKHADARSDVYSLGCTLHFLLTGRTVYGGDTIVKKIFAHRDHPIPSISSTRSDIDSSFDCILEKMIAKSPNDRYQTMNEMIDSLSSFDASNVTASVGASTVAEAAGDEATLVQQTTGDEIAPTIVQVSDAANDGAERSGKESDTLATGALDATLIGGVADLKVRPRESRQGNQWKWIAAGVAAAIVVLGTVVIVVTGPDGTKTSVSVPDGSHVDIDPKGTIDVQVPRTSPTANAPATTKRFALQFDGDARVDANPSLIYDGSHPLTYEARLKFEGEFPKSYESSIIVLGPASFTSLQIQAKGGILTYAKTERGGTTVNVSSTEALARDQVVHIAVVYDGDSLAMYVNGKRQGEATSLNMYHGPVPHMFVIGAERPADSSNFGPFKLTLDEVRFSNVGRYDQDYTPVDRFETDENTMALYHFDEGSGSVLRDSSGNGHDALVRGAQWVAAID